MSTEPPLPSPKTGLTPPGASSTEPEEDLEEVNDAEEDLEEANDAEEEMEIVRSERMAKTEDDIQFEREAVRCGQIANAFGMLCEAAEKARAETGPGRRLRKRGGEGEFFDDLRSVSEIIF